MKKWWWVGVVVLIGLLAGVYLVSRLVRLDDKLGVAFPRKIEGAAWEGKYVYKIYGRVTQVGEGGNTIGLKTAGGTDVKARIGFEGDEGWTRIYVRCNDAVGCRSLPPDSGWWREITREERSVFELINESDVVQVILLADEAPEVMLDETGDFKQDQVELLAVRLNLGI